MAIHLKRNEVFSIKKLLSLLLAFCILSTVLTGCKKENGGSVPQDSNSGNLPVEQREFNYLTGKAFESGQDKTARPIAVMINNSKQALPQSGLETADIIYEMVTEGGITRMMAVYSDISKIERVGSVRSARDQFIQFLLPFNAIYVHIGTNNYAKNMLNYYAYQDIDGIYLGNIAFEFDTEKSKERSNEHCWYTNADLIKAGIAKTNITTTGRVNVAFDFVDNAQPPRELNGEAAALVDFKYSSYADVTFTYNEQDKRYYKTAFGAPQMDQEKGTQLSFDNVFLLTTDIKLKPDEYCADFDLTKGSGYYFYGGKYEKITWAKGAPEAPLKIVDSNGKSLKVNVGKSYIGVLGNDMLDSLKISAPQAVPQTTPAAN